jgi:hypothetical protein
MPDGVSQPDTVDICDWQLSCVTPAASLASTHQRLVAAHHCDIPEYLQVLPVSPGEAQSSPDDHLPSTPPSCFLNTQVFWGDPWTT